jgi:hypothetical protein
MSHDEVRAAIVQNYLETTEEVPVPDEDELRDFKGQVRTWMELDESIKQAKAALKARNETKKALTTDILEFMQKFKIDDLNTRDGKLTMKTMMVAAQPLSQKRIKSELLRLHVPERSAEELAMMIFDDRQKVPRPTLRRLRVT